VGAIIITVSATAIIGLLVGFLVVGVIGVYVGDQMIAAAGLQGVATDDMNATGNGNITHGIDTLYASQTSVIETFALGVTLCKIIIIVSVASIVFTLLQRTGLIPRFGGGEGEGGM
jgi:hypothetical protein